MCTSTQLAVDLNSIHLWHGDIDRPSGADRDNTISVCGVKTSRHWISLVHPVALRHKGGAVNRLHLGAPGPSGRDISPFCCSSIALAAPVWLPSPLTNGATITYLYMGLRIFFNWWQVFIVPPYQFDIHQANGRLFRLWKLFANIRFKRFWVLVRMSICFIFAISLTTSKSNFGNMFSSLRTASAVSLV